MEQLDRPAEATWDDRRLWFEDLEAERSRGGAPAPSDQACALMIDLQAVFCAGAWAAVVILAAAIIESQIRESKETARRLEGDELTWLMRLRNQLLHDDRRREPAITIGDQWMKRAEWEGTARRAVRLVMTSLYAPLNEGA